MRAQTPRAAFLDHFRVHVDADRADAALTQQVEKLAPPAAEIEDLRRAGKSIGVLRLAGANLVDRSAKEIFESDVAGTKCRVHARG